MAVAGRGRVETCVNHPDRPAATRCRACHKPICSTCVVSTADGKFCSHTCAARMEDYRKGGGAVRMRSRVGRKVVRIVVLVVLIAIAAGLFNKYARPIPGIGPILEEIPFMQRAK